MANLERQTQIDTGQLRRARGISQEKLARIADCSSNSVRLHELGYRPPAGKVLGRILDALDELVDPANDDSRPAK